MIDYYALNGIDLREIGQNWVKIGQNGEIGLAQSNRPLDRVGLVDRLGLIDRMGRSIEWATRSIGLFDRLGHSIGHPVRLFSMIFRAFFGVLG